MDWEPLAASTFYLGPMHNTARVGTNAANFIDFLVRETGLKTEDVHFIGTLSSIIQYYLFIIYKSQFHCPLIYKVIPLVHTWLGMRAVRRLPGN